MKVKPLDAIRRNYESSAGTAATRYKEEVTRSSGWQQEALKGQKNFVEQMSKAEILARREKAIQQSSDEEWRRGALDKGANRIGEGIRKGAADQASGYAPYHAALSGKELPERTTDPMQNLINRGGAVVQTLVDKKKELKG